MNIWDEDFASCDVPEDPESKSIETVPEDFIVGTIKWVKLPNFSPWPAIIDDNPDTKTSIWIDSGQVSNETVSKVHVVFFDQMQDIFTRAWIDKKYLEPFTNKKGVNCQDPAFKRALKEARRANKLSLNERRQRYCLLYKSKKMPTFERQLKQLLSQSRLEQLLSQTQN